MTSPIEPQPSPFTFLVGEATTTAGRRLGTIELHGVNGMQWYFMNPEDGERMAEHWRDKMRELRTGLTIVGDVGTSLPYGVPRIIEG